MVWVNSVSSPICEIDFHTEEALYSVNGSQQPTKDLLSVTTSKSLSSSAGTWSVELVGRKDKNGKTWKEKIKPQDLVVIKMGRTNESLNTVMVGLVDEVNFTRQLGGKNEVIKRVKIKGRDFGKVFLKAFIKWFPQFEEGELPVGELGNPASSLLQLKQFYTKEEYQIGSPAELIYNTITNILYAIMDFSVKYWKGGQLIDACLKDLLRFRLGKTSNVIPFWTSMSNFEGSLWNFFTSVQNPPFNELFVDTRTDFMSVCPSNLVEKDSYGVGAFEATFGEDGSKVLLVLRPTPFDSNLWKQLETHEVTDKEVISENLTISDHENYNMFLTKPSINLMGEIPYSAQVKPVFNGNNILKYGISYMEIEAEGVFNNKDMEFTEAALSMGETLTQKLKDWFENNIYYENGSLSLKGNALYKIGQKITNTSTNMTYYIESVTQDFNIFGEWKTTLEVTRGQSSGGKSDTYIEEPAIAVFQQNEEVIEEPETPTYYTVVKGDTLSGIAKRFYGNYQDYTKILDANSQIKDKDLIYPGQKFYIPEPKYT